MARKLAFIFDHEKCIICNACVDACNRAYGNLNWRKLPVFTFNEYKTALSISCNHCKNPLCMKVCPANAYEINEEFGILKINQDKCIGCGYCQWACPYEAPVFNNDGVMSKCHFCYDRVTLGKGLPYCVESCPTGALSFGWIEDNGNDVSYLPPKEITRPRLIIKSAENLKLNIKNLKLKKEEKYLGLLLYTISIEIALGLLIFNIPYSNFLALGFLILGIVPSIFHINRQDRLFRVILNVRTSWLSREVLFGSLAILFFTISIFINEFIILGLISLIISYISSIMIYLIKTRPSWYNIDTPISFIGTSFTVVAPLAYFFYNNYFVLLIGLSFLIIECITYYMKFSKFKFYNWKIRIYTNLINSMFYILIIFMPYFSIISSIISLISEIYQRKEFFEKVLTYSLPYV